MDLRFFISEFVNGDLEIECKHVHYMFRDGYSTGSFPREELFEHMKDIEERCKKDGVEARFVFL